MRKVKLPLIYCLLIMVVCIMFSGYLNASEERNIELIDSFDNREIWGISSPTNSCRIQKYKEVSLGGTILNSYSYNILIEQRLNSDLIKFDPKYYPSSYLRLKYKGFDEEGNIYLETYTYKIFDTSHEEDIIKHINNTIEKWEDSDDYPMGDTSKSEIPFATLNLFVSQASEDDFDEYDEYIVSPSKTIKFSNTNIPPFEIITNDTDSDIEIKFVD